MFNPEWRTRDTVALARQIRESRDYGLLPILADALQDAGCDEPTLSALRDEGIADSRSGLWLAGIEGKDWLWELGQFEFPEKTCHAPTNDHEINPAHCRCEWHTVAARRAELQRLHTGPCPLCRDLGKVAHKSDKWRDVDCPTCPTRERWDRCPCEKCEGLMWTPLSTAPDYYWRCPTCGGSGDLLLQWIDSERGGSGSTPRPLSFDLGPLPVVSARVEEIAREEECGQCNGRGTIWLGEGRNTPACDSCSGTGRTWVPSEWMRSLAEWFDVTLEGVEPQVVNTRLHGWYEPGESHNRIGEIPLWLWKMLKGFHDGWEGRLYPSPTAARLELCRATRRWRFTS